MRLFAKVFEHANFGGQYRWIVENVEYFISNIGFNDQTSSINVYKGNDYKPGDFSLFAPHWPSSIVCVWVAQW